MAVVSRLGLYGGPRMPNGSFAGKTVATLLPVRKRGTQQRWKLPNAARAYNQAQMAQTLTLIERAEVMNHKTDRDIEVGGDKAIIMTDPNGARWKVTVDVSGNLTTEALES